MARVKNCKTETWRNKRHGRVCRVAKVVYSDGKREKHAGRFIKKSTKKIKKSTMKRKKTGSRKLFNPRKQLTSL